MDGFITAIVAIFEFMQTTWHLENIISLLGNSCMVGSCVYSSICDPAALGCR